MIDDDAFWDDGEWVSWESVNSHLARLELQAQFPNAEVELIPIFEGLKSLAEEYWLLSGKHLQVYGDLGELFGAIKFGIKLNKNYAMGSDGKLGNEFVEIKTITPFKSNDRVVLNLERNFSKVLVVKISEDFEIQGRLRDRKEITKKRKGKVTIHWSDLDVESA